MLDASTTISAFLVAAAARQPTPGGGSIAALAGAMAASMGEMVMNYSVGKKGLEAHRAALETALAEFTRARRVLLELLAEDQSAYEALSRLQKLPPDSTERQDKFPAALLACIRVPQAIAATSVTLLELCRRL